jgi:hypothetical protein
VDRENIRGNGDALHGRQEEEKGLELSSTIGGGKRTKSKGEATATATSAMSATKGGAEAAAASATKSDVEETKLEEKSWATIARNSSKTK